MCCGGGGVRRGGRPCSGGRRPADGAPDDGRPEEGWPEEGWPEEEDDPPSGRRPRPRPPRRRLRGGRSPDELFGSCGSGPLVVNADLWGERSEERRRVQRSIADRLRHRLWRRGRSSESAHRRGRRLPTQIFHQRDARNNSPNRSRDGRFRQIVGRRRQGGSSESVAHPRVRPHQTTQAGGAMLKAPARRPLSLYRVRFRRGGDPTGTIAPSEASAVRTTSCPSWPGPSSWQTEQAWRSWRRAWRS